ncbi:ribonuclease H-like domain-containing protein [Tanacetum coccineum]
MVEQPIPAATHPSTQNHNQPNPASTHPTVTQLRLSIRQPNPKYNCHLSTISPIPKSYHIACTDHNWQNAMRDEYNALIKNETWILMPRPRDMNIVCSMWLFKHKYFLDESLSRYKARLVANGSSQQIGVDCDENFSLVVEPTTIRTVPSILASRHWAGSIAARCVKNAFLHGHLFRAVIYASVHLRYATRVGFTHSRCDSSLYIYRQGSDIHYLLFYVDDIILTASYAILLQRIITSLHSKFFDTDLVLLHYFLGHFDFRDLQVCSYSSKESMPWSIIGVSSYAQPSVLPTLVDTKLNSELMDPLVSDHDPLYGTALKRILRYVRGTLDFDYGLQLFYGLPFSDCAEAEYRGVANVVAETAWLPEGACSPSLTCPLHRTAVLHILYTKGLPYALFDDFRSSLSVHPSPALTAGGFTHKSHTEYENPCRDMVLVVDNHQKVQNKKRKRKPKALKNDKLDFKGLGEININGKKINLLYLARDANDDFEANLNKMTEGMVKEAEFMGVLKDLEGVWSSKKKRRMFVKATIFGDALPENWRILLAFLPCVYLFSLYCCKFDR